MSFITSDASVDSQSTRLRINNDLSSLTQELNSLKSSCDKTSTNKEKVVVGSTAHTTLETTSLEKENIKLRAVIEQINKKLIKLKSQFEEQDRDLKLYKTKHNPKSMLRCCHFN